MDYSHMDEHIQYTEPQQRLDELDQVQLDSELLLSKIEYQDQQDSPQINVNAVEAKIKELTRTADPPPKKSKPYCGCGQYYSCTSSLYLHIRSKHKGQPPLGTIGGPKGIVKKVPTDDEPLVKFEDHDHQKYLYPPEQRANNDDLAGLTLEQMVNPDVPRPPPPPPGCKVCKICGKTYSCNSSLNLHLKRKHEMRRREDGTVQIQDRPEDRLPKNYQCSICGLSYGSKSALGLHYNNKHNSRNGNDHMLYENEQIQKCGCGLVYQSRSALNMHVKKKHDGAYPEGTTDKPNLRVKGRSSENFVIQESDDDKPSIYDSDSEGKNQKPKRQQPIEVFQQRVYKCGCGRNYSCSSSLNLHIKKNHDWIVPKGTIGGPRGMRVEQDKNMPRILQKEPEQSLQSHLLSQQRKCHECEQQLKGLSYFKCESCQNHNLCSNCFWKKNNFDDQKHLWNIIALDK